MKKAMGCICKVIVVCALLAGAACAVVAYWDQITEFLAGLKAKFCEKKACCCPSEYDDYADWEQ